MQYESLNGVVVRKPTFICFRLLCNVQTAFKNSIDYHDGPIASSSITPTAHSYVSRTHNMANGLDIDRDSAFGDDDDNFFWSTTGSMFSLQPVTSTKRDADGLSNDAEIQAQNEISQPKRPGEAGWVDLCCTHCPEPKVCGLRPTKRSASALEVGEYHSLPAEVNINTDCQFPDDCFEKFCQECNLDTSCPPDCALPCPGDDCPEDDACFNPHCNQKSLECTDGCVDPDCTKLACPDQPCFCQKCDAQPCPLGDPDNECHFAHTAPTPIGTIYCYDNAPCHFQEGYHGNNNGLTAFETYPCFSRTHGFPTKDGLATNAPTAPIPALSHSNYTSLESAFKNEPSSTPGQSNLLDCYLQISSDHCHIDDSCCHGTKRACGDCPSASKQQLDVWNPSIAQDNGLANNFMNLDFTAIYPTSSMSMERNSNPFSLENPILGYNDQSWMLTDSSFPNTFRIIGVDTNKLDFLTTTLEEDAFAPSAAAVKTIPGSALDTGSLKGQSCICRW